MMKRRLSRALAVHSLAVLVAIFSGSTKAQTPQASQLPAAAKVPEAKVVQPLVRHLGMVSLASSHGVQVRVDNRTAGRITVHGWDREQIEARATSERGEEVVLVDVKQVDDVPERVFLKADYKNVISGEAPTRALELPPVNADGPIKVNLEVNVPRHADIEFIRVIHSNVEITGIEKAISIIGESSNITLQDVGSVEAHTRTGAIVIENARGISDVSSSTGKITIANSRGAVRAVSIAGPIEVSCVKGRIDVSNTQAPIELKGIDGDVDAISTSSDVRFTGSLSDDGRYYMRSMSGRVEVIIPTDIRGFNATLTSYHGLVESDFAIALNPQVAGDRPTIRRPRRGPAARPVESPSAAIPDAEAAKHRLAGRFGRGGPQITLDSFQGVVKLTRIARGSIESCK
ncbi:MAG TPA: hypothetical protein VGO68_20050 [Pyrinomonadaceae bacterium]|jgi:hypothetical protein|nr:hypothetical protein [Pyrinomonadaceae bacterium]